MGFTSPTSLLVVPIKKKLSLHGVFKNSVLGAKQ